MFTGRKEELSYVFERWSEAQKGKGQLLLVRGVAGIGKTVLVRHALKTIESEGARLLSGAAYLPHENLLYAPMLEAFGSFFRAHHTPSDLIHGLDELKLLFPDLPCDSPKMLHDPALEKIRLFRCFATLLERISQHTPTLFFIDDLHWADSVTMELFHYLATIANRSPLLLVATLRSEALEDTSFRRIFRSLLRIPHSSQLELAPLGKQDIVALFQTKVDGPISSELIERLHHQTSGSPLFLCALIEALHAEKTLFFNGKSWSLCDRNWPLPSSIRELVLERLEQVSHEARELLEWMAVCPDGTSHTLLSRATQKEKTIATHIKSLCVPGFLCETLQEGEVHYNWTHPLVRKVIYAQISGTRRHQLHARLAHVLEEQPPKGRFHLANHYCGMEAATLSQKATEHLEETGREARILGAQFEAYQFLSIALQAARLNGYSGILPSLLQHMGGIKRLQGQTQEALSLLQESLQKFTQQQQWRSIASIHLELTQIQWAQLDFEAAHIHLAKGLDALAHIEYCPEWEQLQAARLVFLDRCYDFVRLKQLLRDIKAQENPKSPHFRVTVFICELGFQMREGAYDKAQETLEQMLPLAEKGKDFVQMVRVHNFAGLLAYATGHHAAVEEHYQANMSRIEEHGLVGCEPAAQSVGGLSSLLAGRWEEAYQRSYRGLQVAKEINSTRYHARLHALCGLVNSHQGKFDEAKAHFAQAYTILGDKTDDIHIAATIWGTEATYLVESGQYDAALDLLQRTPLDEEECAVDGILSTLYVITWGHALLGCNQSDKLFPVINALQRRGTQSEYCRAWALYFQAQQTQSEEDDLQRTHMLESVIQTFQTLDAPFHEARARLAWFKCMEFSKHHPVDFHKLQQGERMIKLLQELGAQHKVEQAWELLSKHGITKATFSNQYRYLSKRESEVAHLIVEGLKNAEIAKRLHISPHTVSSHLKRIYTKLHIRSRSELVRFILASQ